MPGLSGPELAKRIVATAPRGSRALHVGVRQSPQHRAQLADRQRKHPAQAVHTREPGKDRSRLSRWCHGGNSLMIAERPLLLVVDDETAVLSLIRRVGGESGVRGRHVHRRPSGAAAGRGAATGPRHGRPADAGRQRPRDRARASHRGREGDGRADDRLRVDRLGRRSGEARRGRLPDQAVRFPAAHRHVRDAFGKRPSGAPG